MGADETKGQLLLQNLVDTSYEGPIILSLSEEALGAHENLILTWKNKLRISHVISLRGRAHQLNTGAATSSTKFLWFIHADTQLDQACIDALLTNLEQDPEAIYYFDLKFTRGPNWLIFNEYGVKFRSKALNMPFGDQAFCMAKDQWSRPQGFDHTLKYGEDHVFIWQARKLGIKIRSVNQAITTSSRKYEQNGWLKTTLTHMYLTFVQAFPHAWSRLFEKPETKGTP